MSTPRYRPPAKAPCRQCPFRKAAMPGWLGASAPEGFIECILHEEPLPCHASIDYRDPRWKEKWLAGKIGRTCAGSLALMRNMSKIPRDPAFPKLPDGVDRSLIFASAQAFLGHHNGAQVKSWLLDGADDE